MRRFPLMRFPLTLLLLAALPALAQTGPNFNQGPKFSPSNVAITGGNGTFSQLKASTWFLSTGADYARIENDCGSLPTGSAGVGFEFCRSGGTMFGQAYDRTGAALAPLTLDASVISLRHGSNTKLATSATGVAVTGSVAFTDARTTAANLSVPHTLSHSGVAVSGAADTAENILATCSIPANAMGANGRVEAKFVSSFTNNGNGKTIRIRYSGIAGTILYSNTWTTQQQVQHNVELANRNATNSQTSGVSLFYTSGLMTPLVTSTIDTTAATTLILTCQKGVGSDACTNEQFVCKVIHGA